MKRQGLFASKINHKKEIFHFFFFFTLLDSYSQNHTQHIWNLVSEIKCDVMHILIIQLSTSTMGTHFPTHFVPDIQVLLIKL